MNPPENAFNQQVNNVMTHRWLVHALRKWLDEQGTPSDSYTPEQVYLAARDSIQTAGPEDRMEDMLEKAKQDWKTDREPTEAQTMGTMFHEWLDQEDLDLPEHPRRSYTMAAILNDVCQALPDAATADKLVAIKALWAAHRQRLLAQPVTA